MKRLLGLVAAVGIGLVLLGACALDPEQTIVVTTSVDGRDAVPGDGICEVTVGADDCSLRAAVDEANAAALRTRVLLSPSTTYLLTLTGVDDTNAAGDLDLAPASGSITLEAPAPGAVIDAGDSAGALDVRRGANLLHGVDVRGADTSGIVVRAQAILAADRTSIHDNQGAGVEVATGGGLRLDVATVSANGGAGIVNHGTATLRFATVAANQGGLAGTAPTTLEASIVGDQAGGPDCSLPATSGGANLDSDGSCGLGGPGDLSAVDPQLGPLSGPDQVHIPAPGSPVVDAVGYGTHGCTVDDPLAVDQVGTSRPTGLGCERGAVELDRPASTVTTPGDGVDIAPGDGTCATADGRCTLRAAIQEANGRPGPDAIVVGDVDPVLSIPGGAEDDAATGDLDVTDDLLLVGRGRTVDGAGLDRVLDLRGARVVVDGLGVTGGFTGEGGGGIRIEGGDVELRSGVVRDNEADAYGGGIAHRSGSLLVDRMWIDGNRVSTTSSVAVPRGGGGLHVGVGTVTIDRSTLSGNRAYDGAGLLNQGAVGQPNQVTLMRSTVTGNDGSGIHGGLAPEPGQVSPTHLLVVTASTIADNGRTAVEEDVRGACTPMGPLPPVCSYAHGGGISVGGSVLAGPEGTCGFVGLVAGSGSRGRNLVHPACVLDPTDVFGDPQLGPLAAEAGAPPVRRPFATSPVIDLIPVGTPGLCDGTAVADQLGAARPAGAGCDAGAVEGGNGITPQPLALVVDDAGDVPDGLPGDGVCTTVGGGCTLRAAADEANAWPTDDAISILPGIDPLLSRPDQGTLPNRGGGIELTGAVSIDGNGATVDAGGLGSVLSAQEVAAPLSVAELVVTGGDTDGFGGGIRGGQVVLTDVEVVANHAAGAGGGVYATTLDATRVVVRENTSGGDGAGIAAARIDLDTSEVTGNVGAADGGGVAVTLGGSIVDSTVEGNEGDLGGGISSQMAITGGDPIEVVRSTVAGNSASFGGGIHAHGGVQIEVIASTITGNEAASGAAVGVGGGSVSITASTVAGNLASSSGGVVAGPSGSVTFAASVVASGGTDCTGGAGVLSGGYNVGADASCALTATGDLPDVDPLLEPLADNGGPTRTRRPAAGSPVLDRIPAGTVGRCDGSLPIDQRGEPRPEPGTPCDAGAVEGAGTIPVVPLSLLVGVAADGVDVAPGDGTCAAASGLCTLRAAIGEANAWPGADEITIASGIDPVLSVAGRDEDGNLTGDLDVLDPLTIHGAGATVSGAGLDRVLHVQAATRVERATLAHGETGLGASRDGGVIASSADLDLANVTVTLGTTRGSGAGLAVSAGNATVVASTFSLGAAEWSAGAISVSGGSVELAGSVVDGSEPRCAGTVLSAGHNVLGDASCGAGPDDVVADPLLGPVRTSGGVDVHLPFLASPVLDAVPAGTPGLCDGSVPTDERGAVRPGGGACDAGATEGSVGFPVATSSTWTVTSDVDAVDAVAGDGTCATAAGVCTLRAAVDEANARPGPDTITFDAARTVTLSRAGARESGNRTGDLDVHGDLVLLGNGSVVDGANLDRVLQQRSGTLQAQDLTLRRGRVAEVDGRGGVLLLLRGGTLDRVVVTGGVVVGNGNVAGGGVASADGSLTVRRSTVADSSAGGFSSSGGAISASGRGATDRLLVESSTVSGSSAFSGSAIYAAFDFNYLASSVRASTVVGSTGASLIGGPSMPALRVTGSIVDWSGMAACGLVKSDGWNVFSGTCWWIASDAHPTDLVAPSGLGALGPNGGPTPTRVPAPGSAPVDRIPAGTTGLCDAATGPDQRGIARPQGAACDVGAVEQ